MKSLANNNCASRAIVVLIAVEVLIYAGFLVRFSTLAPLSEPSSIDTVANLRVAILALIIIQGITVMIIERYVVMIFASLLVVLAYLYWWLATARAVNSMERPSYSGIDHVLFLDGANIADLLVLLCSLAILSISLALFRNRSLE
jgi:hypothetical protein